MIYSHVFSREKIGMYIWMTCFVIYFGHLFFDNGPITKYAQVITDVINIYCLWWFIQHLRRSEYSAVSKILLYLFFMFLLYFAFSPSVGVIRDTMGVESSFAQLKVLTFVVTPFFTAYYFSNKGYLDDITLTVFFIALVIMASLTFISYRSYLQDLIGADYSVNNMGYLICALFPLCTFVKPSLRLVYWGILLFIVLMGGKRGAIITSVSMLIIYLWITQRNIKLYKKIFFAAGLIGGLFLLYTYFYEYFEFTFNRLSDQGLTHNSRNYITNQILTNFANGNVFHYVFGYGTLGSIALSGNFAHNDWLEMMSDYGYQGVFVYFLFYTSIIRIIIRLNRVKSTYLVVFCTMFTYCLCRSYFSMCFFTIETAVVMFVLGLSISRLKNEKNTLIH